MFMHVSELGDCIGVESCVDLLPADAVAEDYLGKKSRGAVAGRKLRVRKEVPAAREFPPQISSMARGGSLPPWVMRKYYTDDGRLVIMEERVKRHEYIRAHRANGRLVMTLVPLEDDGGDEGERLDGEDGVGSIGEVAVAEGGIDGGEEGKGDRAAAEDGPPEQCKYNRVGVNPCGGGMDVAVAFRPPLHT